MQAFPSIPGVDDAPASLFDGGHLWLQEWVDGGLLRFQLQDDGLLLFGNDERVFDPGAVPVGYRCAVRNVREAFDRDGLRAAADDPASVVFYGVAPRYERVAYDWNRTPAFLGFDVWNAATGKFLPPDAVERTFERLGLTPLNAVAKEARATDFDPGSYTVPASNWRDGPAAGVLVRNKTGDRAKLAGPGLDDAPAPFEGDVADAVEAYATRDRVEAARSAVGRDVDQVTERVVETVAREEYGRLFGDDGGVDPVAFRSGVAERVSRLLGAE